MNPKARALMFALTMQYRMAPRMVIVSSVTYKKNSGPENEEANPW
jgi:hypothetical protein